MTSTRVAMLTSWGQPCGVADYSANLIEALRPEVETAVVPAPMRPAPRHVYDAMGRSMNQGELAHVQFTYAFFGGMHPARTGLWRFLAAIRRPIVLTLHELDLARGPGPAEAVRAVYRRAFAARLCRMPRIRAFVTHSTSMREQLLELGVPPACLLCRPMPVPPPPGNVDPGRLRRSLRWEGRRVLAMLGFVTRRKGYETALDALALLPPEYVLMIAGGEHPSDATGTLAWLKGEIERRGLSERVRITGVVSTQELEDATALADVVLAPFLSMSASASLSYAISRRKLIVASDLPQNRTLDSARLFPAGDGAALAAAVQEVLGDPVAKDRLLLACDDYVTGSGFGALAEETRRVYASVLAESIPRTCRG